MASIDGAIGLKYICNAYTTDVNISKAQPSKASGLGGVASQRSKSAPILYKYKLTTPGQRTRTRLQTLTDQRPQFFTLLSVARQNQFGLKGRAY